tara:strand:- start:3353 stop:4126 length:774 start_codon:yes stop_codon:yes gene_type:complete
MCLALIQKPNAKKLTNEQLKTAFNNNDDGCGIAYVNNNKIIVKKYMDEDSLLNAYNHIHNVHGSKSNIMIHFRIGTHGAKTLYNVHPFMVNENLVFCHNGIINRVENCKKRSDTRVFNDDVLKHLPTRFIHNKSIITMMSDFIGHSKLIFLNSDNQFKIVNENLGHWSNGTWFSNSSYKPNTYDFGGYGSQSAWQSSCNIQWTQPKPKKIVTKQTRIFTKSCEKCEQVCAKQHYHHKTSSWVCGVCLNVLNHQMKGI